MFQSLYSNLFPLLQLETSQNKLREFRLEMVAVNEWMDETEQIISGFHIDMDPEEATRLQGKLDVSIVVPRASKTQTADLLFTGRLSNDIINSDAHALIFKTADTKILF